MGQCTVWAHECICLGRRSDASDLPGVEVTGELTGEPSAMGVRNQTLDLGRISRYLAIWETFDQTILTSH